MDIEKRSLDSLTPNVKNPRKHSDAQIQEMWKSVSKFGAIRPIVIDEDGVILAGHGLYEAYKRNGVKEADVLVMRDLSETDKKKLLLADNKIFTMGIDNFSVIEDILKELGESGDFEVPGYDADILEEMYGIKSVEKDAEEIDAPVQKALDSARELDLTVRTGNPEPSAHVERARREAIEQAESFVICPNCGEKVYL